jgi:hypothetical protein
MEKTFNTIHIFGFGDVQVIKGKTNKTKKSVTLSSVQSLIAHIWSKKPIDNNCGNQYHAINIFNGMFVDYQAKEKDEKGYRVKYDELDESLIEALVTEVLS